MNYVLFFAGVFFILSCRKNKAEFDGVTCSGNCYILTGHVIDTPSHAGLPGVELRFYFRPSRYALISDPTRYLGKTTTNSAGGYAFRFDGTNYKRGEGYYYIEATKKNYFHDPLDDNRVSVFYLDSSRFNRPLVQHFALYRPAKLSVRVKAAAITHFEFLTFSYHYGRSGTGIILNGKRAIDTTLHFQTAGDVRTFIQWNAAGNGVSISKKDTLFTTRGGTIQYEVNL